MPLLNGDTLVKVKLFFKEYGIKLLIGIIFFVFVVSFIFDMFRRKKQPASITEKIGNKIDDLKTVTTEINADRKIVNEIKEFKLNNTEEEAKVVIEEYKELEKEEDIHVRLSKKISFYDKINK
jgi:hypothetical protein